MFFHTENTDSTSSLTLGVYSQCGEFILEDFLCYTCLDYSIHDLSGIIFVPVFITKKVLKAIKPHVAYLELSFHLC